MPVSYRRFQACCNSAVTFGLLVREVTQSLVEHDAH